MGDETLAREQALQSLNAETSESQKTSPKKAIPGAPEVSEVAENATPLEPASVYEKGIGTAGEGITFSSPQDFINLSRENGENPQASAPQRKETALKGGLSENSSLAGAKIATPPLPRETPQFPELSAPQIATNTNLQNTENPQNTEKKVAPVPAAPVQNSAELRGEKIKSLQQTLENLGRGEEWTFFARKYPQLLNKPAADADFSDLDNNLQKLSDFLAKDQKFEITKVGNLQIRMAGLPILEEYYAAWLQSKSGNLKTDGSDKAFELRRQIAKQHPDISGQIQAIEGNSNSTDQGRKFAYLRLLAGYAPKEAESTDNQYLNQYGIDDRLATNDQDTTKAAQKAVQQKSPEQNAPPTAWDKYKKAGSPQKAEQDIEKNIQKLPVKAQNGGGKKSDKSDPKNPQQSSPDPLQALWSLVGKLESDKQQSPALTNDQQNLLQSLKILGNAGLDASASVAKGVKSLYNSFAKEESPNVQYMGKGGTIYVHIMDLQTNNTFYIGDKAFRMSKQDFLNAEKESNDRFQQLDINLKVKMVFDLGGKPMNKKQFQSRKDYNPLDSYVMVTRAGTWDDFRDKQTAPEEDKWNSVRNPLNTIGLGTSAISEWHALINTDVLNPEGLTRLFDTSEDFTAIYEAGEKEKKGAGVSAALSRYISRSIEHETGHAKFDRHPKDDVQAIGSGGHVGNTIMATAAQSSNVDYDAYHQTMLQKLHGKISTSNNPTKADDELAKRAEADAPEIMDYREDLPK